MSRPRQAHKLVFLDRRTDELKTDIMRVRQLNVTTPDEYTATQRLENLLRSTRHELCVAKKRLI